MNQNRRLLVLDHDAPRHELFRGTAAGWHVESTCQVRAFAEAVQDPKVADLICLDHELGDIFNEDGKLSDTCGCEAADLAVRYVAPTVPVLIHSSNAICAQLMRRILADSGRRGRVPIVNVATIAMHGDKAAISVGRHAMEELLDRPRWPTDVTLSDLHEFIGDSSRLQGPVRQARRRRNSSVSRSDEH